jgi:eukaryotic-like serine/threonine-protein kinase
VERTSAPKALGGEVLPPGAEPLTADDPAAIEGHRLTGRLAAGDAGVVYLAHDPAGEHVVVKTTRMRKADQTQARRRLRTEATAVRRLPDSCTPRLLIDGSDESPPYLVREYIEGPSLAQFVEGLGPLEPEQLRALAEALARALAAVHDAGLVHCDIEPTNVLLAADGPRLIDFTIAQERPLPRRPAEVGTVPDNPGWVAPERRGGFAAGPASDVFGWGCLLGYAATGGSPFDEDAVAEGRRSAARAGALDAIEEPIRGLVEEALAVDPADRPGTADIVARLAGKAELPAARPRPGLATPAGQAGVDAPTTPMPAIDPAGGLAGHHEPGDLLPWRRESTASMTGQAPATAAFAGPGAEPAAADDLLPWRDERAEGAPPRTGAAEPAPRDRPALPGRTPENATTAFDRPEETSRFAEPAGPVAAGRVAYSPHVPRTEPPEQRPRRLRAVALVTAPAAMLALIVTVVAMATTGGNGHRRPTVPGSVVSPGQGQGPVESQAPVAPSRRSYGPRPASAASAHGGTPQAAGHHRPGNTRPATPSGPGGGHSTSRPPVPSPTPPRTHSPTPSPTPTPTDTGTATG